jgi:hypothetical protein
MGTSFPYDLLAAGGTLAALPCILLVIIFHRRIVSGLTEGYGKEYPFLDSFDPRRFNGTIYYDLISISAGTEYTVCVICEDCCGSGTTATTVNPPHPTWTRPDGNSVVLLDAVQLGGMFGLNS